MKTETMQAILVMAMLVIANLFSLCCLIGAIILAFHAIKVWWIFLVIGTLFHASLNSDKAKTNGGEEK